MNEVITIGVDLAKSVFQVTFQQPQPRTDIRAECPTLAPATVGDFEYEKSKR